MGWIRHIASALAIGIFVSGCIEYEPFSTVPDLGVPNPRDLDGDEQVDSLIQSGVPEVDVLWVVDNSCSMQEEQDGIAENFPVFLNYFQESGLDWHIGVISTDMSDALHQGKLQQRMGYKWVDANTPFPEDVLAAMTRLGTSGSGRERGRDPIYYAHTTQAAANAGFFRPTASLHVVVISDEDDDSELIGEDEFLGFMRTLKWGEDQLTFSSIVSEDPLCPGAYQVGTEYLRYTEELGGIFWSICNDDWATVLNELGLQAVEQVREYYLSKLPIPETIEVTVTEGNTVFPMAEGEDWTYDPIRNSIAFEVFVPNAGNIITIRYKVRTGIENEDDLPVGQPLQ